MYDGKLIYILGAQHMIAEQNLVARFDVYDNIKCKQIIRKINDSLWSVCNKFSLKF